MHLATSVSRPNLIAMGTCFGKFSKSGKFKLTITCLDWLAKYAKYKVRFWFIAIGGGPRAKRIDGISTDGTTERELERVWLSGEVGSGRASCISR